MAVLHRALVTWFLSLVFLILLVLRLDGRTQWNWFIVFIPLWLLDSLLLLYSLAVLVSPCRSGVDRWRRLSGTVCSATAVLLKLCFQICLCLHLQYPSAGLRLHAALAPLLALLTGATAALMRHLVQTHCG
ncbi:Transmembrane protein 60 [Amphibalanus amphitrite]|uniref:Transmembrane protein 60 n=1 Tax=Amphibalanus amphitrite TaxID=1232801 RepID=A0A6A4VMP3_AMPAM|nr:transmembrane protein 60-like [Amphibalanus amphitrite]XP_043237803.1 transmembrane protein 60-like [Amphibalanus amphitrite]KAF0295405.1 Transmembrane protein 60 [Amphibalanus amphitrite]